MASIDHATGSRVFRTPLGWRLASLFVLVLLSGISCMMLAATALAFTRLNWPLGVFFAAIAAFMFALTAYVLRDFRGKWGLRIVLGPDAITLDLPIGRSLAHHPPAQHLTIPYSDIASIDTRLEAYPSAGMETMHRAYALQLKNGELIFLFEKRALVTALETPMFQDIVAALAARPGIRTNDLGMVEGRGGFLLVWGTHAPDWATPSLPISRQFKLWARAMATGAAAMVAASAAPGASLGGLRPRNSPSRRPPSKPQ